DLATFLELALSYAGKTGGAYDPTVGPALKLWGFYDHRYNVPGKADISKAMAQVGYAKLSCDPAKKVASLKDRGMRIDPGGLGRGFALDRAIQILKKEGIGAALIDFGGRRYALGAPPGESAWTIDVRNPFDPSGTAMTLSIKDGAVCTLDRYEQFFEEEDKAYIGIIDSGSGRPIEGMASVTVWGKTCAEADALSMALFVRGIEKGMELAKSFGVEAAWIPVDEKLRLERTPGFGALQAKEK
ncbi:MAG TPA: FAD:protein FMN transferase, partial [Planctomycetota bacterium]|nr:FAD:protein FMN transferase [Planctomycetota bacterium]